MVTPLVMPVRGAAQQYFEPQTVDYLSPEAGGRLGAVAAGAPRWWGEWTLGRTGARGSDDWRAWVARMRGSQRMFYGRDIARPYPLEYIEDGFRRMTQPDGSGPFLGAAAGWSQSIDADGEALLTLETLASGLILSVGDYVGFKWDAEGDDAGSYQRRALVRCITGGMADADGDLTVRVEPPVNTMVVPADAVAHLDAPACLMKFVPEERRLGPIDRSLSIAGGSIKAMQILLP